MKAQTVWRAYQRAKALAYWSVWDHKARRHELAFQARLERIIAHYDVAMEKKAAFFCELEDLDRYGEGEA